LRRCGRRGERSNFSGLASAAAVTTAFAEFLEAMQRAGSGADAIPGAEEIDPYLWEIHEGLDGARGAQGRFLDAAHVAVGVR